MQNGMAERFNRTVLEGIKTLLECSGLPSRFWAEAASHFVYTHNIVPREADKSPHEVFCGTATPPPLPYAFGEPIVFWTRLEKRQFGPLGKLAPAGRKGRFLGPVRDEGLERPGCARVWDLSGRRVKFVSDLTNAGLLSSPGHDDIKFSRMSLRMTTPLLAPMLQFGGRMLLLIPPLVQ